MRLNEDKIIILTGGAGFIGSGVLKQLNALGLERIVVVDRLGDSEKWKNLVGKKFVDLLHKDQLFDWLPGREEEIEAIIHLGACSSTVESDCSYLLENNYRYSRRLAEYALKHEHRFIYASTAATYGDGSKGFRDNHEGLEELQPLNMYGYSKHLFDLWLQRQGLLDAVVGLKYFNVFGPNEYHKGRMASMVLHMTDKARKTGKIQLFKSTDPKYVDGGQLRDFVYVKDVAKITCSFLSNSATGIFNLGSGEASTWNRLTQAVIEALDKPITVEYIEMPVDLRGKYQNYTCADIAKLREVLNKQQKWQFTQLEDAVKEYVCDYLVKDARW